MKRSTLFVNLQFTGLWQHANFMKLWTGQTISLFGSQITTIALPLTAVLVLKASSAQMGILGALQYAPFLLVGLFTGVWVDRLRRRPILITADIGRALLVGSIPVMAYLGVLRLEYLYLVVFLIGTLTLFFDVAYQSFLPWLVQRDRLVEGNSKLEVSSSSASIIGPGLAGSLVQLITAPGALIIDSLSFLVSVLFLWLIRKPELAQPAQQQKRNIWAEIGEGLRLVWHNKLIRLIAVRTATANFFDSMIFTVYTLYIIRELHITPVIFGLIFAVGSIGTLFGALLASRVAQRFGLGMTIIGSSFLSGVGTLFIPLASGPQVVAVLLLITAQLLRGLSIPIYNINQVSLRQAITPDRLLGRMNASIRFVIWGIMPIGALIGGALGGTIGLRATLAIGGIGALFSFLWVFFSPLRSLREMPAKVEDVLKVAP